VQTNGGALLSGADAFATLAAAAGAVRRHTRDRAADMPRPAVEPGGHGRPRIAHGAARRQQRIRRARACGIGRSRCRVTYRGRRQVKLQRQLAEAVRIPEPGRRRTAKQRAEVKSWQGSPPCFREEIFHESSA
jgi:hypothetical protein